MSNSPKCIITGVKVVPHPTHYATPDKGYAADLFEMGEVYIINANVGSGDEDDDRLHDVDPSMRIIYLDGDHFVKRGVFVINKKAARLNAVAEAYIKGTY